MQIFHTCIRCCVRATNTSVCIDSVDKQDTYSIHNSIALIFCIDCLDMPFKVHTPDKVTMITVSGFLTIYFEVGFTVIQTLVRSEL